MSSSPLRSLFDYADSLSPWEQQDYVRGELPTYLDKTNFMRWHPGIELSTASLVLVGVMVSWNRYEQSLLIDLDESIEATRPAESIAVVQIDIAELLGEVGELFPGVDGASQSPFVSLWEDGTLKQSLQGYQATAFLSERYHLSRVGDSI